MLALYALGVRILSYSRLRTSEMSTPISDVSMTIYPSNFTSVDATAMPPFCWSDNFMLSHIPPVSNVLLPEPGLSAIDDMSEAGVINMNEPGSSAQSQPLLPRTGTDISTFKPLLESASSHSSSITTKMGHNRGSNPGKSEVRNSERRKAQNRNAQRLYRRRKDQLLADREQEVAELKQQLERERKLNRACSRVIDLLREGAIEEKQSNRDDHEMPDDDSAAMAAHLHYAVLNNLGKSSPMNHGSAQQRLQSLSKVSTPSYLLDHDDGCGHSV